MKPKKAERKPDQSLPFIAEVNETDNLHTMQQEGRLCNHSCNGEAISVTHSE
jgi:hypothetical protein